MSWVYLGHMFAKSGTNKFYNTFYTKRTVMSTYYLRNREDY